MCIRDRLWGPRDPAPQGEEEFRVFDTQCGLFATSKVLSRYGVPFTSVSYTHLDVYKRQALHTSSLPSWEGSSVRMESPVLRPGPAT